MPAEQLTILERLLRAGICEEKARRYLQQGWVHSGDAVITDPDAAAPERFVLKAG